VIIYGWLSEELLDHGPETAIPIDPAEGVAAWPQSTHVEPR